MQAHVIKPFMTNDLFYRNSLDGSISSRMDVWLVFIITMFYRIVVFYTNSVDPDQPGRSESVYRTTWTIIRLLCESRNLNLEPTTVQIDFEVAMHTERSVFFFHYIKKTYLYDFDPLNPHWGLLGYTLFFLLVLNNIDCGSR